MKNNPTSDTNRILTTTEKDNISQFLEQYYYASAKGVKTVSPFVFGFFLIASLITFYVSSGNYYIYVAVVGLLIFIKLYTLKVPKVDIEKSIIIEKEGQLTVETNATHRIIFDKNLHAYNLDFHKCLTNGIQINQDIKMEYIQISKQRKMIYALNINGIADISLPLQK